MKQGQIVKAYQAIQKHENEELPLDISYAFFKVKKQLTDQWNFQLEREKVIFDKYKISNENGQLTFEKPEDQNKFIHEIEELADMEIDWEYDKVKVNIGDRMQITISELEALDEFMEFK